VTQNSHTAQVPIAKPSDLLYTRALADGVQVELIEAERRFFCVYKWVHGVKFQIICLPNGMIGNLAGHIFHQFCNILTFFARRNRAWNPTRSAPLRRVGHCSRAAQNALRTHEQVRHITHFPAPHIAIITATAIVFQRS
jgi:hypothetical protein